MMSIPLRTGLLLVLIALSAISTSPAGYLELLDEYEASALVVINPQGETVISRNPDKPLIPASTVKLLTALVALEHWGKSHRFQTNFYYDETNRILWAEGLGDPFLISEELDQICAELKATGLKNIAGIGIDSSYFAETIVIDGLGETRNPYDAPLSALSANFNSFQVKIVNGVPSAGEPQTPLTPIARKLSRGLSSGVHRVSLDSALNAPQNFAELLRAKLQGIGVGVDDRIVYGDIPTTAISLLPYKNRNTLEHSISAMLKYSNNFIANQLYLALGADVHGAPATIEKSQAVFDDYINKHFTWRQYSFVEGSGLSRQNRLSARQLTDVLKKFQPYRYLMSDQGYDIRAKTGTLQDISTYAGYYRRDNAWSIFALLVNQNVNYNFRRRLAAELLRKH